MLKHVIALLVLVFSTAALGAGHGGGGPFGGQSTYPFPVVAGGDVACYDEAMTDRDEVRRYDDWNPRDPANCEIRWEEVPDDRRA